MKTFIFMTLSLDGFIARKDDEVPFIGDSEWKHYCEVARTADALVVGRKTYDVMLEAGDLDDIGTDPYMAILTQDPASKSTENPKHIYTSAPLEEVIQTLSEKGVETVMIGGGAQTNTAFLQAGCVDEVWVDICPHILGQGIPFIHDQLLEMNLTLIEKKPLGESGLSLRYACNNK